MLRLVNPFAVKGGSLITTLCAVATEREKKTSPRCHSIAEGYDLVKACADPSNLKTYTENINDMAPISNSS